MVVETDSIPARALLYAMLAFSSLHQSGFSSHTLQLKISALHFLSASANGKLPSDIEAAKFVAASMLLGAFDVGLVN